jgi:hypothetical protein
MSRKSTAALSVVPIGIAMRVQPPADFTEAQKAKWVSIVNEKPVDWFGQDTVGPLGEHVRALCMCDTIEGWIQALLAEDDKAKITMSLDDLLKMRDRESKRAIAIATKLRLTQQSRYTPQAAATATKNSSVARKPWQ